MCCPDGQYRTRVAVIRRAQTFLGNDCYSEVEKAARVNKEGLID